MTSQECLFLGELVRPYSLLPDGAVLTRNGRIAKVGPRQEVEPVAGRQAPRIKADGYISPGYIDLHVHGGAGADFMDGTPEAFRTVLRAHAKHGTTTLLPTGTVARHDQLLAFLDLCRRFKREPADGARVLGAHFYGPYFGPDAQGCHPAAFLRPPKPEEYNEYLKFADSIATATVAPELPGAEEFVRACRSHGIVCNIGHSNATFAQVQVAVGWGVRHVDHLYCAMSDKRKLTAKHGYPMQGGLLEATLYFDELTTEVIADGKHLSSDLLLLALKIKGPDLLALVTDCSRALDMPDGPYLFGPTEGGEPFVAKDGVGRTPNGGLASSVRGMDHMVRTFVQLTGRPLWEVIRMASLTPARIAGCDKEIGSLEPGKEANILVLDRELNVRRVFISGVEAEN